MAKFDSLWSDGVFLGYRSISGEVVVGARDGVFKTRTVQRKAYEHRWRKENLDMVGGVPWKTSPDGGEEEAIMPAIDIGMEMPEVEIPSVPTENHRPIPRRLYIKARDIETRCHCKLQGLRGDSTGARGSTSHRHVPKASDR